MCLKAIMRERELEVVGVVTQPDRPAGRGKALTPCPCKAYALSCGILEIISPENVNSEESTSSADNKSSHLIILFEHHE